MRHIQNLILPSRSDVIYVTLGLQRYESIPKPTCGLHNVRHFKQFRPGQSKQQKLTISDDKEFHFAPLAVYGTSCFLQYYLMK